MAAGTLLIILILIKTLKRTPAPIIAISLAGLTAFVLRQLNEPVFVETIADRFQFVLNGELIRGIPQSFPPLQWPWQFALDGGLPFKLSLASIRELSPSILAISLLGAIESLLSAVVADGMTGKRHDPNSELLALGIGNMICPFFGGIPATGAIARTTTNIRFGGGSPIAAMVHAIACLLAILLAAPLVSWIPMAALAALLLFVANSMSERKNFINILRYADWEDKAVMLACFVFTVLVDMTVGVSLGVVLACILFIKRISSQTEISVITADSPENHLPDEFKSSRYFVYRISGSLFFGAAQQATESILNITNDVRVVILEMEQVGFLDSTGAVALRSALSRLKARGMQVAIKLGPKQKSQFKNRLKEVLHDNPNVIVATSWEEIRNQV